MWKFDTEEVVGSNPIVPAREAVVKSFDNCRRIFFRLLVKGLLASPATEEEGASLKI